MPSRIAISRPIHKLLLRLFQSDENMPEISREVDECETINVDEDSSDNDETDVFVLAPTFLLKEQMGNYQVCRSSTKKKKKQQIRAGNLFW